MSRAFTSLCCAVAFSCLIAISIPAQGDALRNLKDPTRPPNAADVASLMSSVEKDPTYVLSAILLAEGRQIAVINGEPLQVGDQVKQAEVISISRDRVMLRETSGKLTLRLIAESIRSTEGAKE